MQLLPGSPHPLGASWDGRGVNFALYSENATAVELCLFDAAGNETRLSIPHRTAFVWHAYVPDVGPAQRYGYRVHGPYEPERGLRFNPNLVLLDPYAKALDDVEHFDRGCFAYELGSEQADLHMQQAEQLGVPRGVVIDESFDWEGDAPPRTPLHRSVIYEAHVRGLTRLHPELPEALRGTYAGIGHPVTLSYLRELGVTAIELMPVHAFVDDKHLLDRGLSNYWGYNSIGFFAPDIRYRAGRELGGEVREFKEMVKALHRAGIEVILDVVYNHTAEGNHLGPTFSFKGIDNPTYYRLVPDEPRYYFDYTGTGNTLNVRHPQVLALMMDSLRYWAADMHVDGFRFDLASSLARQLHEVDRLSSFFSLIHQSPLLSGLKLIAEPWDVGEGGYQVGNFPVRWAEWNGRYRDAVRALWRGDGNRAAEIGYRLTGSSDLYEGNGRRPSASINLITAHDGFTLHDLVSYAHKHNEPNGEDNRDGADHDHSFNCGVEGPTDDARVLALRRRQQRNLLATMLLSQGTPMLLAGDEYGRSQRGNNNAYCQDNELSWFDWDWSDEQHSLFEFTRKLLRIRAAHPALHRSKFFQQRSIHGTDLSDLLWFRHDGVPLSTEDWQNPATQSLGMFLAGRGIDDVDEQGRPLVDDNLLLLINASEIDLPFTIPVLNAVREPWRMLVDTADDRAELSCEPGETLQLPAHSLKLLLAPSRVIRKGGALHTLGATYRLQLHAGFDFGKAVETLDYLKELGVTDLYLSPIFAASAGSSHGYDVVDHQRLDPALGGEAGFAALSDKLRELGMGLLLDWVPNHMGIEGGQNKLWDDVLENGPDARYAHFFDISWKPPREDLHDRVLLPILGDQYGVVLERGELAIAYRDDWLHVCYFDHRLPLAKRSVAALLDAALSRSELEEQAPERLEAQSILSALRHLSARRAETDEARLESFREGQVTRQRLSRLLAECAALRDALAEVLTELNGSRDQPHGFDALDRLLREQSYRLASWRVAAEEINYRRFFDINALAAIRMEDPAVFEHAHAALLRLLAEGKVNALRLDHTDGLYDPRAYFETLQRRFAQVARPRFDDSGPDDAARPLPLLVEKILEPHEQLRGCWPVDGTTGYEFASAVLGLWVDRRAERALSELYRSLTGDARSLREHVYECKKLVIKNSFSSELNLMAQALQRIAREHRRWRDFTWGSLKRALAETLAAFPVYRTYVLEGSPASDADVECIRKAIGEARERDPDLSEDIFTFLEELLTLQTDVSRAEQSEHTRFALRLQQLTGPVMAKAVEDTAFYRFTRFVCLNEVGSMPDRFGTSLAEFHAQNAERARSFPLSMSTTSTHDTKRGEDVAARLAVLSELPQHWSRTLSRLRELSAPLRKQLRGGPAPNPASEYLFYQTLVGAWPPGWDGEQERAEFTARLASFMQKAGREAKQETSWTRPDAAYEEAVRAFVEGTLASEPFRHEARALCELIAPYGAVNGLAQTLLRLCSPGVPDTYQGAELWNLSLVDPDNRREVDFAARRRVLESLRQRAHDRHKLGAELLDRYSDGAIKLYVHQIALALRRERRDLFTRGDYEPLPGGEHVVAFTRGFEDERVVCIVPRFSYGLTHGKQRFALGEVWKNARLPLPYAGRYRNLFSGEVLHVERELRLAQVFAHFPVALLIEEPEGG
jgi:isoamylase